MHLLKVWKVRNRPDSFSGSCLWKKGLTHLLELYREHRCVDADHTQLTRTEVRLVAQRMKSNNSIHLLLVIGRWVNH